MAYKLRYGLPLKWPHYVASSPFIQSTFPFLKIWLITLMAMSSHYKYFIWLHKIFCKLY